MFDGMSIQDKKKWATLGLVVIIGVGSLFLFMPKPRKSLKPNEEGMQELPPNQREHLDPPVIQDEHQYSDKVLDAMTALTVYIQAFNEGQPQEELDELNKELVHEMGLKIIRRRSDNKLVVKDLHDVAIMEYPSM